MKIPLKNVGAYGFELRQHKTHYEAGVVVHKQFLVYIRKDCNAFVALTVKQTHVPLKVLLNVIIESAEAKAKEEVKAKLQKFANKII